MSEYTNVGTFTYEGNEYQFGFNTFLTKSQTIDFVQQVADAVVVDGNYYGFLTDLVFDCNIIRFFTDVDIAKFADGIDDTSEVVDFAEKFVNKSNISNIVRAYAEPGYIALLREFVDRNIEYKTGIHGNIIEEKIASFISTINDKIGSLDIEKTMNAVVSLSKMSGDFTPDKILSAFANSNAFTGNSSNKQSGVKTNKRTGKKSEFKVVD